MHFVDEVSGAEERVWGPHGSSLRRRAQLRPGPWKSFPLRCMLCRRELIFPKGPDSRQIPLLSGYQVSAHGGRTEHTSPPQKSVVCCSFLRVSLPLPASMGPRSAPEAQTFGSTPLCWVTFHGTCRGQPSWGHPRPPSPAWFCACWRTLLPRFLQG